MTEAAQKTIPSGLPESQHQDDHAFYHKIRGGKGSERKKYIVKCPIYETGKPVSGTEIGLKLRDPIPLVIKEISDIFSKSLIQFTM